MAAITLGQLELFDPQVDDWVMYTVKALIKVALQMICKGAMF